MLEILIKIKFITTTQIKLLVFDNQEHHNTNTMCTMSANLPNTISIVDGVQTKVCTVGFNQIN
jgi:hypothetical protein